MYTPVRHALLHTYIHAYITSVLLTFGVNEHLSGSNIGGNELLFHLGYVLGVEDVEYALADELGVRALYEVADTLGHVEELASVAGHHKQETLGALQEMTL